MKAYKKLNLFIVDDDRLMTTTLKHFLDTKFGNDITISTFSNGESCLEKVDKTTDIVLLDYMLEGKNGLEILKLIKKINPKTEVIMLSSNEDIALAIDSFRAGAKDYVVKGKGSWIKINRLVMRVITKPIRILVKEFGISKFMAIFLLTFVTMGVIVYCVMNFV
ncbi:MAG: response regulator [Bacteroidota bacterium]